MTAIHETAYPRIRSNLSDKELEELYTPSADDLAFIDRVNEIDRRRVWRGRALEDLSALGLLSSL